jgi:pimeloyl-ACP methyl ester carboxylesterase
MPITGSLPALPDDAQVVVDLARHTRNAGKITTLSDPMFGPENCAMAMWRPLDFLRDVGGGLFMLQEYQPDRLPVVFVHGMGGSPRDWIPTIEGLDRSCFQPWVYFYPGGLRLDMLSDGLVNQVNTLSARHRFDRLAIVAHSMGGLVTRSFVKKYTREFPEDARALQFVITVNSPMGGLASAAAGVKRSPIVLPAWRDVAVDSEFLKGLYAWQWPTALPYHLVFSYKDGDSSDGTIPLTSQLPLPLQAESVRLYGFNDTHVGTLGNQRFLEVFHRILAMEFERAGGATPAGASTAAGPGSHAGRGQR